MYTEFFGLSAKPFELLPNPKFIYLSKGHRKALSYLQYGVQERAGFTLLTGEVGSGKTTLIRDIINKNHGDSLLAMIFNTRVDAQQLIAMINDDFGLQADGKNKTQLLSELNDFLIAACNAGRQPIIIIDEAQNLSAEALEEVRLLSNLEADTFKLVQIILVGQPELKQLIARPELRQLRQRISLCCHLSPLNREETEEYIFHRLGTVGKPDCVSFQTGTIDLIFDFSGGVPRLINVICDFLLLSAFVEETRQISLELVMDAVEELSFEDPVAGDLVSGAAPLTGVVKDQRLLQIEQNYAKLNASRLENESILERLESQGNILKYLINQQQKQFTHFEERLENISDQINHLRRSIQDHDKQIAGSEKLLLL
jgi:putative secretion ATPase (PEP-CTERM system associated)